jgi:glycine/D-amino acid oxidase-like deaminating enzyme
MQKSPDVIVIGGGPAGVHAAYPLVEAGLTVLMIDGGVTAPHDLGEELQDDFESLRREREDQQDIFLGKPVGELPFGETSSHIRSMTSGNRTYLSHNIEELLPLVTENVQVLQTLAQGGLSEAWSGACDLYDAEELRMVGIPPEEMPKHYQKVIDRIGVSGTLESYQTQPAAVPLACFPTITKRTSRLTAI